MKRNFLIAFSMLLCMSAFSIVLTACSSSEEPIDTTMSQEFYVKGMLIEQDGNYVNGEAGLNDPNTKEFKFYKAIYDEVEAIIKAQAWEITFKSDEKNQKIKEQNAVAEQRYSAMVKSLDAVQKKLDQTNKDEYKCHFSMKIELVAMGEKEICKGQKT
ncbi:MAG: hypothetical protein J5629_05130, partial [Muribaculaceae bacterium]|nr:hypothetical protein [Muribaculaceae bacterium]